MLLTYDAPSPSMQTVRAVVGGNNIGVAPGSLMDVFDPSGALIPAPRADSMRAVHAANYGGPQVRRDLVVVGNGLLRLGGAAVDAHLDALRREKLLRDALVDLVGTDDPEALAELRALIVESGARVRVRYLNNHCASAASLAAVDALLATGGAR